MTCSAHKGTGTSSTAQPICVSGLVAGELREAQKDQVSGGAGNDGVIVINRPAFKDVVTCGTGFDRVLADREDLVAPDCERVFIGLAAEERFFNSFPGSFWGGLPPFPEG